MVFEGTNAAHTMGKCVLVWFNPIISSSRIVPIFTLQYQSLVVVRVSVRRLFLAGHAVQRELLSNTVMYGTGMIMPSTVLGTWAGKG